MCLEDQVGQAYDQGQHRQKQQVGNKVTEVSGKFAFIFNGFGSGL